jgi:tRNA(Ile)-lysidine synthase
VLDRISHFSRKHTLLPEGSTVVLGLSGGPDSVFLLHFLAPMHHAGIITLVAAHLDHQWRTESGDDAEWCVREAQKLNIACTIGHLADFSSAITWNGSKEEVGRKARRLFLERTAEHYNADRIALAHHAQDQQETFFMRLIRGTTVHGLTGMQPHSGLYIRPLLEISKTDILAYLNTHSIAYLVDSSNDSNDYLRNRIRHNVLPALHAADNRFEQNFRKMATRLQATQDYLQEQTKQALATITATDNGLCAINTTQLLTLHPVMQQEVIITWLIAHQVPFSPSESFLREILRFAKNGTGIHAVGSTWSLIKKKEWLWVKK